MPNIERRWTLIVGGDDKIRGYIAGKNHIVSGVRMDDREIEVVPADDLRGAVKAMRIALRELESLEGDIGPHARLSVAQKHLRSALGGR